MSRREDRNMANKNEAQDNLKKQQRDPKDQSQGKPSPDQPRERQE